MQFATEVKSLTRNYFCEGMPLLLRSEETVASVGRSVGRSVTSTMATSAIRNFALTHRDAAESTAELDPRRSAWPGLARGLLRVPNEFLIAIHLSRSPSGGVIDATCCSATTFSLFVAVTSADRARRSSKKIPFSHERGGRDP